MLATIGSDGREGRASTGRGYDASQHRGRSRRIRSRTVTSRMSDARWCPVRPAAGMSQPWRAAPAHGRDTRCVGPAGPVTTPQVTSSATVGPAPRAHDARQRRDHRSPVLEVPGGASFIRTMARRLSRFAWAAVAHDVLKVLYESVIGTETRKRLGEYYTPNWLAEQIVTTPVPEPLTQRVLDPACRSGTFLFHAVRRRRGQRSVSRCASSCPPHQSAQCLANDGGGSTSTQSRDCAPGRVRTAGKGASLRYFSGRWRAAHRSGGRLPAGAGSAARGAARSGCGVRGAPC